MNTETYSLANQQPQFEVSSLNEWHRKTDTLSSSAQRTTSFEIIWVREGLGRISIDLITYSLYSNTIYCIAPGHFRKLHFDERFNGYYLAISSEWLYWIESLVHFNLFGTSYKIGVSFPPVKISNELSTLMSRIIIESKSSLPMKTELIKGYAKVLLIHLSRIMDLHNENKIADKDEMIVSNFFSLLRKNYMIKKDVASYANDLCITPSHLSKIVRRVTGHPASFHIHQIIVLEAKRRALQYGAQLKEVASELGFDDYAHFSKYFKNHAGVNFSDFRRNEH
jgi:AraC family transcriptional regulator, transcriptional activator of pobA